MTLPPIVEECGVPGCPKPGRQWFEMKIEEMGNKKVPLCDEHYEEIQSNESIRLLYEELDGN